MTKLNGKIDLPHLANTEPVTRTVKPRSNSKKSNVQITDILTESEPKVQKSNGHRPRFLNSKITELAKYLTALYVRKNTDYGSAFANSYKEFGPVSAIIRINDKIKRYNSLIENGKQLVSDESINDTVIDAINYAVLTLMEYPRHKVHNNDFEFVLLSTLRYNTPTKTSSDDLTDAFISFRHAKRIVSSCNELTTITVKSLSYFIVNAVEFAVSQDILSKLTPSLEQSNMSKLSKLTIDNVAMNIYNEYNTDIFQSYDKDNEYYVTQPLSYLLKAHLDYVSPNTAKVNLANVLHSLGNVWLSLYIKTVDVAYLPEHIVTHLSQARTTNNVLRTFYVLHRKIVKGHVNDALTEVSSLIKTMIAYQDAYGYTQYPD